MAELWNWSASFLLDGICNCRTCSSNYAFPAFYIFIYRICEFQGFSVWSKASNQREDLRLVAKPARRHSAVSSPLKISLSLTLQLAEICNEAKTASWNVYHSIFLLQGTIQRPGVRFETLDESKCRCRWEDVGICGVVVTHNASMFVFEGFCE